MHFYPLTRNALAIAAIAGLALSTGHAATLTHDYELNGSYADSLGGPSLVNEGGTLTATGYNFAANQGLNLSNAITPGNYSIELNFSLTDVSGYRKLVDYQDLGSDAGLYNLNSDLNFYPGPTGSTAAITSGTQADVIVTRDSATNSLVGYLNGVQQFTYADTSNYGVFSSPNNIAEFFHDDTHTGGREASAGSVDFIRVFNGALTSTEAATLYANGVSTTVPEPSQFAVIAIFGVGLAALGLRARKRSANAA